MTHRNPQRFLLPQWVRRGVYGVAAVCLASGIAWLYLHHFVTVEGAFGPEPSSFEPPMLIVHGIAAAAMIWFFGLLWLTHVRRAWYARRNRGSGGTMVVLMGWLCLSGFGLYYVGHEVARAWIGNGHWAVGLIVAIWLPVHIWRGRRTVRNATLQLKGVRSP